VEEEVRCPECNGTRLYVDHNRAEIVCANCGAVVAERLIEEGRTPPSDHQAGSDNRLLPQLFYSGRDSEGRLVASDTVWRLRNTAKYQNLKSSERAILNFEARLRHLAQQRNIPDSIVERATDLYHRMKEMRVTEESKKILVSMNMMKKTDEIGGPIFNKPNLQELALALLLSACRERKYMMTLKDLTNGSGSSINKVKHYHYAIIRVLGLADPGSQSHRLDEMSVEQYIVYYAAKLGFTDEDGYDWKPQVISRAFMYAHAQKAKISSDVTQSQDASHCVAAAALYIAATEDFRLEISQKDFCEKVNLSEISLRDWHDKLGGHSKLKFEPPRVDPDQLDAGP